MYKCEGIDSIQNKIGGKKKGRKKKTNHIS